MTNGKKISPMAHLVVAVAAAFASVLCTIGAFLIGSFGVSLIEFFVAGMMLYAAYLNAKKYLEAHGQKQLTKRLALVKLSPLDGHTYDVLTAVTKTESKPNAAKSADCPGRT